jgi:transgelin
MASVSSLDGDLRKLRLDKYTPGAAKEARAWIEGVLGEQLPAGDLLDSLKDGVALCRYVRAPLGWPWLNQEEH